MILTKETDNSKEIHVELTECILHLLNDQKSLINNINDYAVMNEMCARIRSYLIDQKGSASRLLARLERRSNSVCYSNLNHLHGS